MKDKIIEKIYTIVDKIYSSIDKNKKTVVFISYLPNYRNHVGFLHRKFKEAGFNVINIVDMRLNDRFEKEAPTYVIPKSININGEEIFVNIDIDFIDLIITSDFTWFEKGGKNIYFLSKKAKKIFLPHDILSLFYKDYIKYNFIPSRVIEKFNPNSNSKKNRNNFKFCLIPGGYPKLDYTIRRYNFLKEKSKLKEDSILYAPTMTLLGDVWDERAVAAAVGYEVLLIETLLNNFEENIIFRPHPHNFNYYRYHIAVLKEKFKNNKRVIFNLESRYLEAYIRAKLLITDMSDTAYTFSFSTLKPSIYFFHSESVKNSLKRENVKNIGLMCSSLKELVESVRFIKENSEKIKKKILEFRDSFVFNIGKSEDYLIENIEYILYDKIHPDWVYVY